MTAKPPESSDLLDRIQAFVDIDPSDTITSVELNEFEELLRQNKEAQVLYLELIDMLVCLPRALTANAAFADMHGDRNPDGSIDDGLTVDLVGGAKPMQHLSSGNPSSLSPSPVSTFPTFPFRSPLTYLSSGWPLAYLIATVVLGIGAIIGSLIYVSQPTHFAVESRPSATDRTATALTDQQVGRITAMVGCKWAGSERISRKVVMGSTYNLASGLLEITYDSGAKVVLQGPCTFEVDSASGGFLSIGKLTARVESRGGGRRTEYEGKSKVQGSRFKAGKSPNLQISKSPNSSPQPLAPSPLFTVRTPTAIVTDLGTEFGVEVRERGQTMSYVYCGSVQVQPLGIDASHQGASFVLRESESATIERDASGGVVARNVAGNPGLFVRRLVQKPKMLDLLDIVAGGDGLGRHRNRGIDPATGMEAPSQLGDRQNADSTYRPVTWHKFIDGVFIPNGADGQIVLNTSGQKFDRFPHTTGETSGEIWARSIGPLGEKWAVSIDPWLRDLGPDNPYMPHNSGLLWLHANAGITFDLRAMRDAYPDMGRAWFRAVAGMVSDDGLADVWVFLDSELKLSRIGLRKSDGPIPIDLPIGLDDEFLTIVSTDGGNGISQDWVILGEPRIELE